MPSQQRERAQRHDALEADTYVLQYSWRDGGYCRAHSIVKGLQVKAPRPFFSLSKRKRGLVPPPGAPPKNSQTKQKKKKKIRDFDKLLLYSPELGTDLVTALAGLDVDDLTHFVLRRI